MTEGSSLTLAEISRSVNLTTPTHAPFAEGSRHARHGRRRRESALQLGSRGHAPLARRHEPHQRPHRRQWSDARPHQGSHRRDGEPANNARRGTRLHRGARQPGADSHGVRSRPRAPCMRERQERRSSRGIQRLSSGSPLVCAASDRARSRLARSSGATSTDFADAGTGRARTKWSPARRLSPCRCSTAPALWSRDQRRGADGAVERRPDREARADSPGRGATAHATARVVGPAGRSHRRPLVHAAGVPPQADRIEIGDEQRPCGMDVP